MSFSPFQRHGKRRLEPETLTPGPEFYKCNYLDVKNAAVFPWLVKIFDARRIFNNNKKGSHSMYCQTCNVIIAMLNVPSCSEIFESSIEPACTHPGVAAGEPHQLQTQNWGSSGKNCGQVSPSLCYSWASPQHWYKDPQPGSIRKESHGPQQRCANQQARGSYPNSLSNPCAGSIKR